ncbi:MAG: GNAT family N-acetyltransferase [Croceitalea sp.]|nr:GNAT family N-acetyltransferase [Croceitalea sp.]NNL09137.1 GNAT family N-acetyltransferase [Croceitalea sp.]
MYFDFKEDYIMENERVTLTPLQLGHIEELSKIASEAGLWTYFLGKANGHGRFKNYVGEAIKARENKQAYAFAVYDKKLGEYAGSTRLFEFSAFNTVRLGYSWLGKAFRGSGVNKNVKFLLFQFAFESFEFERVGLGVHRENLVSIEAMKSVGCKQEGIIRNLFPAIESSGRADAVLFGILKEEWLSHVKNELKQVL